MPFVASACGGWMHKRHVPGSPWRQRAGHPTAARTSANNSRHRRQRARLSPVLGSIRK